MEVQLNKEIYPHLSTKHGITEDVASFWLHEFEKNWENKWVLITWGPNKSDTQQFALWYKTCQMCGKLKTHYEEYLNK